MKGKILIFDFDGVICDSVNVKTDAFSELYKMYGKDVQKAVVQYHLDNGGISRFEKIKYFQKNILGVDIIEEDVNSLAKKFSELAKEKVIQSPYIPGVLEFIKRSSEIVPIYICTGTPEDEIFEILERKKLTPYFTGVYGSPKTKNEIIQSIIAESKAVLTEIVFLGDAMTDYKAAVDCGVQFIGIKNNHTCFPLGTKVINDFSDPYVNDLINWN